MLENTVWLTQLEIAELFGKGRSTIAEHISAIFEDGELESASVCRKFRQTADDGKLYDVIHSAMRSCRLRKSVEESGSRMIRANRGSNASLCFNIPLSEVRNKLALFL